MFVFDKIEYLDAVKSNTVLFEKERKLVKYIFASINSSSVSKYYYNLLWYICQHYMQNNYACDVFFLHVLLQ